MRPITIYSLNLPHTLIIARLGAWLRITQSFAFLPLGSAINRVPSSYFYKEVVAKALRDFSQFGYVAKWGTYSSPITPPQEKLGGVIGN
jgi:hypothetical protein